MDRFRSTNLLLVIAVTASTSEKKTLADVATILASDRKKQGAETHQPAEHNENCIRFVPFQSQSTNFGFKGEEVKPKDSDHYVLMADHISV